MLLFGNLLGSNGEGDGADNALPSIWQYPVGTLNTNILGKFRYPPWKMRSRSITLTIGIDSRDIWI